MRINPKKYLLKRRKVPCIISDAPNEATEGSRPAMCNLNQDATERKNLEKLRKSLEELILEKEQGSEFKKSLKTFAL